MKSAAPIIAAGSAFASGSIGGLLLGIWIDRAEHAQFYAVAGLFIGMAAGGYAALRLLMQAAAR